MSLSELREFISMCKHSPPYVMNERVGSVMQAAEELLRRVELKALILCNHYGRQCVMKYTPVISPGLGVVSHRDNDPVRERRPVVHGKPSRTAM